MVSAFAFLISLSAPVQAPAQEPEFFEIPRAEGQWTYGRRLDESQLRFCIDRRDPDWEISSAIGHAVASALLLEPVEHVVEPATAVDDITKIYAVMLEHCDTYMGFKLIPDGYQSWATLTRAYYEASYVYVSKDPAVTALSELAIESPIGARLGTSAFLTLVSYRVALPAERRWPLFPIGTNELTLEMLWDGRIGVAQLWEPTLWASQRADPRYAAFHVIDPAPLPRTTLGVGAIMLANQTFLRTAFDEAVAALVADGTIGGILESFDFPGEVPR